MCTRRHPLHSLQAANTSLDSSLQQNLVEILTKLSKEFKLKTCIVMQGMCPPQLLRDVKGLERSYYAWNNQQSEDKLFEYILKTYGAHFYQ
jgi:ABC-type phosphonate transport system ATPase subunit